MDQKNTKTRQIAAIIGIVLLAAIYLTALICAFIQFPLANQIMWAALFCTFVIPVILYAFLLTVKKRSGLSIEEADAEAVDTETTNTKTVSAPQVSEKEKNIHPSSFKKKKKH